MIPEGAEGLLPARALADATLRRRPLADRAAA
jgi:hypothetical protein